MDCSPPGSSVHGDSQGKHTGMGFQGPLQGPLQGIFPTQGLNPLLPHCRRILYLLSHQGSPRILGWVGYPFSRGSSRPRNRTGGLLALQADSLPAELLGKPCTEYTEYHSAYVSIPISQFIPRPPRPVWCPSVCSLHLCLCFCFANKLACTIFLDSAGICCPAMSAFLF